MAKYYRITNFHISGIVKGFILGLVIFIVGCFAFDLPYWLLIFIYLSLFAASLAVRMGKVSVIDGFKNRELQYKDLDQTFKLKLPVDYQIWWNYEFKSGLDIFGAFTPRAGAAENNLYVYLEMEDTDGKFVTFIEKIKYSGRFPNEAVYKLDGVREGSIQLKVNRADKLLKFIQSNLSESEFT